MREFIRPYIWGILGGVLLVLPAVFNGMPLFFYDTEAYFRRPGTLIAQVTQGRITSEWVKKPHAMPNGINPISHANKVAGEEDDGGWYTGRSVYWAVPMYVIVLIAGIWGVVFFQGALIGCLLALVFFRCLHFDNASAFMALCGMLAVGTAAGPFASLLMPDILAGGLILSIAVVFAYWPHLTLMDKTYITIFSAFAVLAHDSHLLLVVAALLALILFFLVERRKRLGAIVGVPTAFVASMGLVGLVGSIVFDQVSVAQTGKHAVRFPHISAHIQQLQVGQDYIRSHCSGSQFAICRYRDRLPVRWDNFLFDGTPDIGVFATASSTERRVLSDEQVRFALAVFRQYPLRTILELTMDGVRQVFQASYVDLQPLLLASYMQRNFPTKVFERVQTTPAWRHTEIFYAVWLFHVAIILVSLSLLILLYARAERPSHEKSLVLFGVAVVLGLVANAMVCGVLAAPYDRFQARVIWLMPLLIFLLLLRHRYPLHATKQG